MSPYTPHAETFNFSLSRVLESHCLNFTQFKSMLGKPTSLEASFDMSQLKGRAISALDKLLINNCSGIVEFGEALKPQKSRVVTKIRTASPYLSRAKASAKGLRQISNNQVVIASLTGLVNFCGTPKLRKHPTSIDGVIVAFVILTIISHQP
jgi:hypothetical protein